MATSQKLETIYYNGQPDGIRSIRRHLSTMRVSRILYNQDSRYSHCKRPVTHKNTKFSKNGSSSTFKLILVVGHHI